MPASTQTITASKNRGIPTPTPIITPKLSEIKIKRTAGEIENETE